MLNIVRVRHKSVFNKKSDKEEEKIYYNLCYKEADKSVIIKIVNANMETREVELAIDKGWNVLDEMYRAEVLTGQCGKAVNSMESPENVATYRTTGSVSEKIVLPALSFSIIYITAEV